MSQSHLRLATDNDIQAVEAARESLALRREAISEWTTYYFNRPTGTNRKGEAIERETYPVAAQIIESYLGSTADIATFTPEECQKLISWLFNKFYRGEVVVNGYNLATRDVLIPQCKRVAQIIFRQGDEGIAALKAWRQELFRQSPKDFAIYLVSIKHLRGYLVSLGFEKDSPDYDIMIECLQLLAMARLTPNTLNSLPAPLPPPLCELGPEDLEYIDDEEAPEPPKHCPGRGGLRLIRS